MANTTNYTMTRNLIDNMDNVGALCAIIRSLPIGEGGGSTLKPITPEDYPVDGGAVAEEGTTVTSKIYESKEEGVDYLIKTSVSAAGASLEPKGVTPQPGNESGAVRYVIDSFWERPSEEVTKYEVQPDGTKAWMKSNVDTQGDKKGMRIHREMLKPGKKDINVLVKWEKATDEVVSTVRIQADYSNVKLADYEVTVSALETRDEGKLVLKLDKALPEFMEYTIAGTEPGGKALSVKATADGLKKDIVVADSPADGAYKVASLTAEHLSVTGLPLVSAAAPETTSLVKGAKMTTTATPSAKAGIDYEVTVDVTNDNGEPKLAATVSGAGSGDSKTMGYWVGVGFEAPDGATKLEFKRSDAADFKTQEALDKFSGKQGFISWGNAVTSPSIGYTIKWEKEDGTVVETNEYSISLSDLGCTPLSVTATVTKTDDNKVKVTLDKAAPVKTTVTVTDETASQTKTFTSDGKVKEFTLDTALADESEHTIKVEGTHITVTSSDLKVSKAAPVALAAATKIAATPTATAANTTAKKATAKKASTKKTTTPEA